jgi:hypothetical protein
VPEAQQLLPLHAIEMCGESKGVALLILNLDTGWRLVIRATLRPLYLRVIIE